MHPVGINTRESRDISKRINNCFESLFSRQLFQEAYSLRKSHFIVIHIPGDFDKMKRSYKRSYVRNKQGVFSMIVLARTEHFVGTRKELQVMYININRLRFVGQPQAFTLNVSNVFRPHYPRGIKRNNRRPCWIFVFEENHTIIVMPSFSKSSIFKMFSVPHENERPAFSNSSGLKSFFKQLRFRDGLNKAAFLNFSDVARTLLSQKSSLKTLTEVVHGKSSVFRACLKHEMVK